LRRSGFTSRSRTLPDAHTEGNVGAFSEQIALRAAIEPDGPMTVSRDVLRAMAAAVYTNAHHGGAAGVVGRGTARDKESL
jgi:hypothetical protein